MWKKIDEKKDCFNKTERSRRQQKKNGGKREDVKEKIEEEKKMEKMLTG